MVKRIDIVCPAHNEAEGILAFLSVLDAELSTLQSEYAFTVVVVDDGSTDATAQLAGQFQAQYFDTRLLRLTRNFGKESAILAGLDVSTGDACIVMDTDLQHPPALLRQMLEVWQQGAAVVESVKQSRGRESASYGFSSRLFYGLMHALSGLQLQSQSDYKLLDARVVQTLRQLPERTRFFRGLVEWSGFESRQIAFDVPERQAGQRSWSTWSLIRYSVHNLTSFTSAPLHLVTLIGALMLVFAIALGSITAYHWLTGQAVTGFTTVIFLLLFIGSILMVSLGIIGLYLSRIYDEIKSRPVYLIASDQTCARRQGTDTVSVPGDGYGIRPLPSESR